MLVGLDSLFPVNRNPLNRSRLLCSSSRYKEEFEEIELLGEGGFGCVFEVRNKLDGRRYAIKKIKLTNFPPEDCLKVSQSFYIY